MTKALGTVRNDGFSRAMLADELAISGRELNELAFGLVVTAIKGGGETAERGNEMSRPHFRIVK